MKTTLRIGLFIALTGVLGGSFAYRYTALQNNTVTDGAQASQINSLAPRLHVDVDTNITGNPILLSFDGLVCGPLPCNSPSMAALTSSVEASKNRWNDVRTSTNRGVKFSANLAPVSGNPCSTDGRQLIGYSSTQCNGESWPTGLLAVATTVFQSFGDVGGVVELDIVVNPNKNWGSFDGPSIQNGQIDLNRVMLHEMGHSIGLDHPDEFGDTVDAIMNSTTSNLFELQSDDIAGDQDIADAIESVSAEYRGGLVGSAGFQGIANSNDLRFTASPCFFESALQSASISPDGELALILTQTNNVNEAGRHVTANTGPQADNGSNIGAFSRNLDCPQKQFTGTFVQPVDSGNYFQHLGFFSLDGSLLSSVTFPGTQFFAGGGPAPTPTPTVTSSPTATPTAAPTATPTAVPTSSPVPTLAPTATPVPTASVAPTATPVVTTAPTMTPAPTATPVPTNAATATPAPTNTPNPTLSPTITPAPTPTAQPSIAPTATPVVTPTSTPSQTVAPTATPTPQATATPDNGNPGDDQGGTIATAAEISVVIEQRIPAAIDQPGDEDVFGFRIRERREVTINSISNIDVEAVLLDADGRVIDANDDATARSKNFSLAAILEPGQYFILVRGVMNATGPYELSVSSKSLNDAGGGGGSSGAISWLTLLLFSLLLWRRRY